MGGWALSPGRERAVRVGVVVAVVLTLCGTVALVPGDIDWSLAWKRRALFMTGLALTAAISAGALVIGLILGTLAALARVSRSVVLDQLATTYVELVRGTPFLVQLYIWYACIARALSLHRTFGEQEAVVVGIAGLGVFAGAYVAEVVRAAVLSIDRGQWEAARSLGLSHRQTLVGIILPQCMRRLLPPLTGEAVSLVKESSLLSIISVAEITYHAKAVASHNLDTFAAYLPLAALYLSLTLPLSLFTRRMELRLRGADPLPVARL